MICFMQKNILFSFYIFLFAFLILGKTSALAQSPADDFARQQAEQQKKQQIEQLQRFTPNEKSQPIEEQTILPKNGACFFIDRVAVSGAKTISLRTISKVTDRLNGKCINLADIQGMMKSITNIYLEKGYVAARVYIPKQDIKQSHLFKLFIVEGNLSDIYSNGKKTSAYNGVIKSAFPRLKGRVLNMRDVEQGLDQMNRLSSNNAKSELLPGGDDGSSILNINNDPSKRWHVNLSHDTLGQASTGYAQYNASITFDNVLQINDIWNFGYQRSNKDYWGGNKLDGKSNSYSGSVSIPNGYWTFNFSGYKYDYSSIIPGNFGPIATSGDSSELRASGTRLIHRDGKSITTLNFGLAYKETNNFLLGNKIEVGSRQYSVANLGLSHSRQMLKGTWTFDVSYLQGLHIFNAIEKHDPSAGNADPQFAKFTATINAVTPFKVGTQNFILNNLLVGQYSPDNLLGAEQMSIGSYANVRGSRESLAYGNNGYFMRNDFVWRLLPWRKNAQLTKILGELRPYAGLDYGQIFGQSRYGLKRDNLASWTLGAKLVGGVFSLDSGYSKIFLTTVNAEKSSMAFISVAVNF